MNEEELRAFRTRFGIPISDAEIARRAVLPPAEDSTEMKYLRERRAGARRLRAERARSRAEPLQAVPLTSRSRSSTRAPKAARRRRRWCSCGMLSKLLRDKEIGKLDRADRPRRSAHVRHGSRSSAQVGIYSHAGQLYEPVDMDTLLYYKEATDGQILEEGITEAGSMSSFIAAGTAYATHGVNTIPFFIYYSMFGFQRIGDLIWAAADSRARGFLLGGTAGRTTLAGEGLQHQDGNSQLLALRVSRTACPTIRRSPTRSRSSSRTASAGCTSNEESIFYYLTVMNEQYAMPRDAGRRAGRHPEGHVPLPRGRQAEGEAARRSCSAAARFCPR